MIRFRAVTSRRSGFNEICIVISCAAISGAMAGRAMEWAGLIG